MAKNRNLASTLISAFVGAVFAVTACFVYFYVVAKPTKSGAGPATNAATRTPVPTTGQEIPNPDVVAADVTSISINTVYKGYFDPGTKCAKTYNEYFGNEDGIGSSSSPCTIKIEFARDGSATRVVDVSRWDKTAKQKTVVESTSQTGKITPEQFDDLAKSVVANEAFRGWREGTMINVSNCSITVKYAGRSKSVMSNVDEKTTDYFKLVDAIRLLDKSVSWN